MSDAITVLLIDDDPADRALIKHSLESHPRSFAVSEKDTQDGVVEALESSHYDVAIMDYKLKGISGLSLVDSLRSRKFDVPVIMLTGTGTEETAITAMRHGVADYVIKRTANIERLPYTIEYVVERSRAEHEVKKIQLETEQTRDRLVSAIGSFPDGFTLFDAEDRLVVCSTKYTDYFFSGDREFVQPGVRFEDLLRRFVDNQRKCGASVDGVRYEEYLAWHREPGTSHEYRLVDGKRFRTLEYRTPDGAIAGIHTSITETRNSPV